MLAISGSTLDVLTANGYAVMQPSVNLEIGHPGESWVKGVTAAANKLIEMGIADGDRLGVSGTSYGGYATALLITQTTRFKAAIPAAARANYRTLSAEETRALRLRHSTYYSVVREEWPAVKAALTANLAAPR